MFHPSITVYNVDYYYMRRCANIWTLLQKNSDRLESAVAGPKTQVIILSLSVSRPEKNEKIRTTLYIFSIELLSQIYISVI